MKKLFLLLSILFLFYSNNISSQPYMGGEIGWECTNNGNYRFFMKLYRFSGAGTQYNYFNNLTTDIPNLPLINLSLHQGYPKEISNSCDPFHSIGEYLFTTDSIYPNGVQLSGTAPAQGWKFSFNSYNPVFSNNINSDNHKLKAIMYPTPGSTANTCLDNSPVFPEPPISYLCSNFQNALYNPSIDKDEDDLTYQWAPFEGIYGYNITYTNVYSYSNPIPVVANSLHLDTTCGYVQFNPNANGNFWLNFKVTSFKNGVKKSEVYREYIIHLMTCGTNSAPIVNNDSTTNIIKDTVVIGNGIGKVFNAFDNQINSNSQNQILTLSQMGNQFGSYIPSVGNSLPTLSTFTGCLHPPCASLTPASNSLVSYKDTTSISSLFFWQTGINHIPSGESQKEYTFSISFQDDYCPIPAKKIVLYKVLVINPYLPKKPVILNTKVLNSNADVEVTWGKCKDSINLFHSYEIYSSTTKNGIYNLVDSEMNVNDTSLIHLNTAAGNNEIFYFSKIKYLYNGAFYYTQNSDTVTTQFVDLEVIDTYVQFINPLHGYVRGTIRNNGNTTVDTLIVHYYFGQGQFLFPKTITWAGVFQAKDTIQIPFPVDSISSFYSYTVCTFVSHPKDYVNYNDSTCRVNLVGLEDLDILKLNIGKIHPSPSSGKLFIPIESQMNETASIEIFNQQGMKIKSIKSQLISGSNEIEIDLEKEENGVYFYVLEISGQSYFGKIVLVK